VSERTIAGRYRLDEPLGLGAMASVWAAYDAELERPVAVKVLRADADRSRFEREARAAAMLTHPNVCRLYDFGESDEGPYIVLELLPGGTLEERLADGAPLADEETARIAAAVAAGLAHAHEQGLVHRDLKPANILFDAEDRPKIADFGIARIGGAGTLTEAGTVLGTAAYIAPEQASGQRATPASDVYSFGVILYRLLTGRLPFEAEDAMRLLVLHAHEPPPPVAEIRPGAPADLALLADDALAKDPADRPADGTVIASRLRPPAGTEAATAVLAHAGAARAARVPRAALAALAVIVLGLTGLGAALLIARDDALTEPQVTTPPTLPTGAPEDEETPAEPPPAAETETEPEPEPEPETQTETETETETETDTATETEPPPTEPPPTEESAPTEPPPTETEH
jgi:eukaryotic-like serine/threonine-protein kinase